MNPNYPYPYMGNAVLPQSLQQTQVASKVVSPVQSVQPVQPMATTVTNSAWVWKPVADYQTMLRELIPLDGTPALFMLENEPVFYIVRMSETGRKIINGYSFNTLDVPAQQPVQQVVEQPTDSQRLDRLENSLAMLADHMNKMIEVYNNESRNENASVQRQPITNQ